MAYFIAPLITVSALVETAIRLANPLALRMRTLSGHVVLGGAGRLTLLYVRRLREKDSRIPIVIVDNNPNHQFARELKDVHRAIIVIGDVSSDGILRGLRLPRAHRVLFLTGDDFVNLDAAAKSLRLAPNLAHKIVVHVSDLGVVRETAGSSVARDCEIFNGHQFAAVNLVHEQLIKHFRATEHRDLVVLAGFGRFGQTVLDQLQQHALGRFGPVVIFDEDVGKNVRAFAEWPGFSDDYEHIVLEGNLRDPELWRHIGGIARRHGHDPVVILASGDDDTNLHAALRVRRNHPGAYAVVRSFRTSPFLEEVAEEAGAHAFNLGGLIVSGMPDSWF
jgi:voltage-gated potassium channel Kch